MKPRWMEEMQLFLNRKEFSGVGLTEDEDMIRKVIGEYDVIYGEYRKLLNMNIERLVREGEYLESCG